MPNMTHGKAAHAGELCPAMIHGGARIERAPIGYRATGGYVPPDWKLAFYHGVWHATRGQRHVTHASLAECVKLARAER